MVPYLVIGVATLIGLFGWGLKGLILGAIGGWLFNLLLGGILLLFSGGLVPRKVRKQATRRFIVIHRDLARSAFPDAAERELQRAVERYIEGIFKRASIDNKSMDLDAGWDRAAIQAAAAALIAEERRPEIKSFLTALEEHIEKEMYP